MAPEDHSELVEVVSRPVSTDSWMLVVILWFVSVCMPPGRAPGLPLPACPRPRPRPPTTRCVHSPRLASPHTSIPAAPLPQALGPAELKDGREEAMGRLRRRSVQVCDVHRRLQDMSIEVSRKHRKQTDAAFCCCRGAAGLCAADACRTRRLGVGAC